MSLNEYVWISRQIYTAIMAEAAREDGDAGLKRLQNDLDNALRRQNGNRVRVGVGANPNPLAGGTNESRLLDYHWLQVPAATRDIVRQHETELSQTMDAAVADSLLLNVNR